MATGAEDRPTYEVRDDPERNRYELLVDGRVLGIAEYHRRGDVVVLPHTEIDARERGQSWGEVLVRAVLDDVRRQGLQIVPQCWFVADFVGLHPDYGDLVA